MLLSQRKCLGMVLWQPCSVIELRCEKVKRLETSLPTAYRIFPLFFGGYLLVAQREKTDLHSLPMRMESQLFAPTLCQMREENKQTRLEFQKLMEIHMKTVPAHLFLPIRRDFSLVFLYTFLNTAVNRSIHNIIDSVNGPILVLKRAPLIILTEE
jgi:hypothetical protein